MSTYDKASLVLIPSGTKEGVVFSQKPTNGDGDFTFTRASSATRVNADGLIEKETQNLLLQSNSFDTTWFNINTTELGGQSGYDGSSNAWLVTKSAANGYIGQNISQSGVTTFSVYAKANDSDYMQVLGDNGAYQFFNLSNGILAAGDGIDATIESIGGGWYRCSMAQSASITRVRIYPAEANTTSGTSGSIYIQDAQLEEGLVARDYIETTTTAVYGGITDNVPRLDYTGGATCPALLLEPQRTNLLLQSEYFGGSEWSEFQSSVSLSSETSPEGYENAYEFNEDFTTNFHRLSETFSATSGTNYTLSVFAKYNSRKYLQLTFNSTQFGSSQYATFDLEDGEVSGSADGTATITEITDGWYRCTFSADATSSASSSAFIILSNVATGRDPSYLGNGSGVFIYGAQLEEGSYATSYIPTYGTSVTFSNDACYKTGVSDLIGQPNGSIFLDFVYDNNFANTRIFSISENNWISGGSIRLEKSSGKFRWNWVDANTTAGNLTSTTTMVVGTRYKIAITYTATSASLFLDGVKEDTSSVTTPTQMNQIHLNELGGGFTDANEFQRNIFNQVLIFNSTLTDQEAIDLTTI